MITNYITNTLKICSDYNYNNAAPPLSPTTTEWSSFPFPD